MENQSESKNNSDLLNQPLSGQPPRPDTVHDLSKMFQSHLNRYREQPAGFDINPKVAAKQWVQLQDPPGFSEKAERKNHKNCSGFTWNTPYLDRLKRDLWKFFQMSRDDQQFIVDAKLNKKLTWRGEPMAMFKKVYELCT